jgi:hypothetical protein
VIGIKLILYKLIIDTTLIFVSLNSLVHEKGSKGWVVGVKDHGRREKRV